jgi:hypothetical protein
MGRYRVGGISWVLGMILNGVALQIGSKPKYRSFGIAIYYLIHIFLLGSYIGPLFVFVIGYFSYTKWCSKLHSTLTGIGSGCIGIIIANWSQFIVWTATPIISYSVTDMVRIRIIFRIGFIWNRYQHT